MNVNEFEILKQKYRTVFGVDPPVMQLYRNVHPEILERMIRNAVTTGVEITDDALKSVGAFHEDGDLQ